MLHKLPAFGQIVALHEAIRAINRSTKVMSIKSSDLTMEEFLVVYQLLRPEYIGPFFSTFYESSSAWRQYVYSDQYLFEKAVKLDLWEKYVGLGFYDPHAMGELAHSLQVIAEGLFPDDQITIPTFSPWIAYPAYSQGLNKYNGNPKNARFIGALSPISVSEIWHIFKHLLPNDCNFEITDMIGFLTPIFSKGYGIPFKFQNALEKDRDDLDLIFSNSILTSLVNDPNEFNDDYDVMVKRQLQFLHVCFDSLVKDGAIVLVEHPIIGKDIPRSLLLEHLREAGFTDISVTTAEIFKSRKIANKYMRKENITTIAPEHLKIRDLRSPSVIYLIVAHK